MCVLRALFFAAMMAILTAAQAPDADRGAGLDPNGSTARAGSCIDPNGCAQSDAGVRMDDNG
jgi:hypothetical protein